MCVLLSLILCLLKRLSNSHLLMSFVSLLLIIHLFLLLSFRFFIILSVPPTVVGLPSSLSLSLFFSLFYFFFLYIYIIIIIIISLHTNVLVSRLHSISKRRSTRNKNIYMCMETKINFN